jgi:integrase/recombinase XerD
MNGFILKSNARNLENFIEMMAAERSASNHTLSAYITDIQDFLQFIEKLDVANTALTDLTDYIHSLATKSLATSSVVRKISALRQFFQFLVLEGVCAKNVALDIVAPKRPQHLPKALAQAQMMQLLETAYADLSDEGVRAATMLEMLYASGMRISELLSLKLHSMEANAADGIPYIILRGKGGVERIVLLNDDAFNILEQYKKIRQNFLPPKTKSDWLFPSIDKKGKVAPLTRQRFGHRKWHRSHDRFAT